MSDFLMSCSCKGRRPKHVASSATHSRPHLIADLLRSRDVARFLVAPTGFGKSTVAAEYAQVVFSFRQTFWVNCESPCFLRDLDAGIIASRVAEIGGAGSLVVFDDLPRMDELFFIDHRGVTALSRCDGQPYMAIFAERIAGALRGLFPNM